MNKRRVMVVIIRVGRKLGRLASCFNSEFEFEFELIATFNIS